MSYDYDGIEVDLEAGEFTIFVGGTEYTYDIEEHGDLLVGAAGQGVPMEYKEIEEAESEDIEAYYSYYDRDDDNEPDY